MIIVRRTYWTNGMVTDRDVHTVAEEVVELIQKEVRRLNNGPGIVKIVLSNKSTGMITFIEK